MAKRVAILQSNYIPWKGYFDIIHDVDEVIFLDDVQYTRQDWRNRNRIKTARGLQWLTIPVGTSIDRRICDVVLPPTQWNITHWRTLTGSYARAPFFRDYQPRLEQLYLANEWHTLSELNQQLIRIIAGELLGITTTFRDSRDFACTGGGATRVLELLRTTAADVYVSGPAGRQYLHPPRFAEASVELVWKDYCGYPEYPQLHPPFEHHVTILDLLFHVGPDAPRYIWGWRE